MYQNRTESVSKPNTFGIWNKRKILIFNHLFFWHHLNYIIRVTKKITNGRSN